MLEYESGFELYKLFSVLNLPQSSLKCIAWMGWDGSLIMDAYMYSFVKEKMKKMIDVASFVGLSVDETGASETLRELPLTIS